MASAKTKNKESKFASFIHEFKENIAEGTKTLGHISSEMFEEVKEKT